MPPSQQKESRPASSLSSTLQALDAQIRLLAQRIKVIENNQQVVGQTLVKQNKKIKELEQMIASSSGGKIDLSSVKEELKSELEKELSSIAAVAPPRVEEIGAPSSKEDIENLRQRVKELEQAVSEIKYVLETINPMEYVTIEDVGDIVERKLREKQSKGA